RIDRKRLRDVADGAAAAPVEDDAAVERRLAENSEQQGALAGAVRPDDDMQRAAFDVYRDAVEQRLAMAANGDAFDLDDCRPGRFLDHASVTSARIMVSAFRCISRSNLSAVYAPDAMWVIVYTFTPASSRSTFSIASGKVSSLKTTRIFSRCRSFTMSRSSAADGVRPCAGWTTPATSRPNSCSRYP